MDIVTLVTTPEQAVEAAARESAATRRGSHCPASGRRTRSQRGSAESRGFRTTPLALLQDKNEKPESL